MRWLLWLRDFFDRDRLDIELDEELRDHLARETERNIALGISPQEARSNALKEFGQLQDAREGVRSVRHGQSLDSVRQDVSFAFRVLRKNKTFSAVAICTLAVGIGANLAIFSLVYGTLMRPLPYRNSRLVAFVGNQSLPDVLDIARSSKTLENLGVVADMPFEMPTTEKPVEIKAAIVGGDVFSALAVEPQIGRYFTHLENDARLPVAVISDEHWSAYFHRDPQILGKKITLSGTVYEIIGVMPATFHMPRGESQVWVPFSVGYPEAVEARGAHFTFGLGSLRASAKLSDAQQELKSIGAELARLHPEEARTFSVVPLRERMVGKVRTPLLILFGAVSLVLLIACVNYSSLLLSRSAARQREFNIRLALGAGRLRVVRQMLTESVVISLIGASAGLLLAYGCIRALLLLMPKQINGIESGFDTTATFVFAVVIAIACGTFFGIVPALQMLSTHSTLRESAKTSAIHHKRRSFLIVAECAMAVMLLSGAGLLIRSFWKLVNVDPGFEPRGLLTMRINLPTSRYAETPKQVEFLSRLDRELANVPEIESSGIVSELPLSGTHMEHNVVIKGRPEIAVGEEPEISAHEATPRYFGTMHIPLLAGRTFADIDTLKAPAVAIITRSMADQFFPGEDPIGAQVAWARSPEKLWMTIVGVVGDVRHDGLDAQAQPALYTPVAQKQMPWKRSASIVVRTRAADPLLAFSSVQQAVLHADAQLPVTLVEPMTQVMAESLETRRFNLVLLCAFAAIALLLAVVGIYGVVSFLVLQRTQEIGIRVALGARPSKVVAMIMSDGLSSTAIGVVIGVIAGAALLRLARGMLYAVSSSDPLALGGAVIVLLLVAAVACFIPARRAAKIDPVSALRVD
jgi:putative ABC transport system permease protein